MNATQILPEIEDVGTLVFKPEWYHRMSNPQHLYAIYEEIKVQVKATNAERAAKRQFECRLFTATAVPTMGPVMGVLTYNTFNDSMTWALTTLSQGHGDRQQPDHLMRAYVTEHRITVVDRRNSHHVPATREFCRYYDIGGQLKWRPVYTTQPRYPTYLAHDSFPHTGAELTRELSQALEQCNRNDQNEYDIDRRNNLRDALFSWLIKDSFDKEDFRKTIDSLSMLQHVFIRGSTRTEFVTDALKQALDHLTLPDSTPLSELWQNHYTPYAKALYQLQQAGVNRKVLSIQLSEDDPDPLQTVKFMLEEYAKYKASKENA